MDIYKECVECKEKIKIILPEYENGKSVILEHSFKFDIIEEKYLEEGGLLKIADIAYLDENKKMIWICEILNTHKTEEGNRPEPWNEIDAKELLKKEIKENEKVELKCCREFTCEKCYEKRYKELEKKDLKELLKSTHLECFIRYKLKQRIFSNKINTEHLRICFDTNSKKEVENNNNIILLFEKYYEDKKIILETSKGTVKVKFLNKNQCISEDLSGFGTIEIIKYILENIQKIYVVCELSNYDIEYYKEINNRIYIDVNFNEKEKIKKNGGKWDIKVKKWYIDKDNTKKKEILKNYKEINVKVEYVNVDSNKNLESNEEIDLDNIKNVIDVVKKKLKEVKNINQIKKYEKILKICQDNEYMNFDLKKVILTNNEYHICIIHPKTNKKVNFHLKYESLNMPYGKRILETRNVIYCVKKNIKKLSEDKMFLILSKKKYGNILKNIIENKIPIQENIDDHKLSQYIFNDENNENIVDFMLLLNYYKVGNDDIEFLEYIDNCIEYDWKIENIIEWLKSDGTFKRCKNCNCVNSYKNNKIICKNKYCLYLY